MLIMFSHNYVKKFFFSKNIFKMLRRLSHKLDRSPVEILAIRFFFFLIAIPRNDAHRAVDIHPLVSADPVSLQLRLCLLLGRQLLPGMVLIPVDREKSTLSTHCEKKVRVTHCEKSTLSQEAPRRPRCQKVSQIQSLGSVSGLS